MKGDTTSHYTMRAGIIGCAIDQAFFSHGALQFQRNIGFFSGIQGNLAA